MSIFFAGLKTTGSVDTVWCVLELRQSIGSYGDSSYYDYAIVWGRRGGKLQTVVLTNRFRPRPGFNGWYSKRSSIGSRINDKLKSGYERVSEDELHQVHPDFEKTLSKCEFWQRLKLSDSVKLYL